MNAAWVLCVFLLGAAIGISVGIARGYHQAHMDNAEEFRQIADEWDAIVSEREQMQRTYQAMASETAERKTTT